MPGAVGAIVGSRRHRAKPRISRLHDNVDDKRFQEYEAQVRKRAALRRVFNKFDTNASGKLEKDQIIQLLTAMDHYTEEGTPPSEEEVEYILKVADQEGDDCLTWQELEEAIIKWNTYIKMREEMHARIKEFDKSGTGKLEPEELREYLASLNGGKAVTDAEVSWVLGEADAFGDGAINQQELVIATSAWYTHVRRSKQGCRCGCTVS